MSDPTAASFVVDSFCSAGFVAIALRDNNFIPADAVHDVSVLLANLRHTDFDFDYNHSLVCNRTLADARIALDNLLRKGV